jgi:hypothetical protein
MQRTATGTAATQSSFSASVFLALAIAAGGAHAATVACGVGDRVHSELGGGKVGTIEEIGTQSPHVGWYRISYDWAPGGEWYPPATLDIHPEGSADRCQPPSAAAAATSGSSAAAGAVNAPTPQLPAGIKPSDNCRHGTRVVDRQQRSGEVQGELNGMCVVALDNGGSSSYLAWMLSPEGAGPGTAPAGLSAGRYVCSTAGAGHFDVQILDDSTYADRAGKRGSYSLAGDRIEFESGSLADYYSRILGPAKFGLSTEEVRTFYVVCNLK